MGAREKCPIGLDEKPELCSAGTCYSCLAAELDRLREEVERLRAIIAYHHARNGVAADIARDVSSEARPALQGETNG